MADVDTVRRDPRLRLRLDAQLHLVGDHERQLEGTVIQAAEYIETTADRFKSLFRDVASDKESLRVEFGRAVAPDSGYVTMCR
jgi:hypothetical protein